MFCLQNCSIRFSIVFCANGINDSVYSALARNIPNVELKDYAIDVVYEINLSEFIDEQLDEINWLNMIDGEDDGRFDDIVCDLKPSFEDS